MPKHSSSKKSASPSDDIEVFQYLNYRSYLRDYYLAKKDAGRGFSYRAFARRAQLRSPNYLKLVIDGERNLTAEMAERFGKACGLRGQSLNYFLDLVQFNQAKTEAERSKSYARLTQFRRYREVQTVEVAKATYHSKWYLPAIRELVVRSDFQDDPAWIATALLPSITTKQAADALETLAELGLLQRNEDGRLVQSSSLLTTGAEARSIHIARYHRTMMERATQSLELVASSERDISSLTLCLGPDGIARMKERIQRFRRELLEISDLEQDPEQVVQINFQLFPLSQRRTSNKRRKGDS